MQNKSRFCGEFTKLTVKQSENNKNCLILNAMVKAGDSREFVQMFGVKRETLKMKDEDGEDIEIAWEDRFDDEILKKVPYFRKTRINVNGDDKEFISTYDAIKYLYDNFEDFKNTKLIIQCRIQKDSYNGKIRDKFEIQNIYQAKEDDKKILKADVELYWNKSCIDDADWDDEKKLYINGYVEAYDREAKENRFYPHQVILNCSKVDFNDERQKKLADYRVKRLKTKSKTFIKDWLECVYVTGAEEQDDFTYDDLTSTQKEMVDLGLKAVEDFRPKGGIYGDFVREYRVINFPSMGDYDEGSIDSELTEDDIEEKMYIDTATESKKSSKKSSKEESKKKDDDDFDLDDDEKVDLEDLFV